MRVHLIKKQTIADYIEMNAQSNRPFKSWLSIIKYADWSQRGDILSTFRTSDLLGRGSERIVFNIGGNRYRIICKYYFGDTQVHLFIKWIGTHAEYSKLCDAGLQYDINKY